MKKNYTYLLLVMTMLFTNTVKAQVAPSDSLALIALYDSTDGPHWTNHTNWLTSAPIENWFGVSAAKNKVKSLVLSGNNLRGTIPAELANLKFYDYYGYATLNLSNNQLTGNIPTGLGNNSTLFQLYLDNNQLTGSIPAALGNSVLWVLSLSSNKLTGSIPPELGNMINLGRLILNNNQLTGSIPPELGNPRNLTDLIANDNQLTGSIPQEIVNIRFLSVLSLYNNKLTGSIPQELFRGKFTLVNETGGLSYVNLSNNQLTGSIPSLATLPYLYVLDLSYNQLSGVIPDFAEGKYGWGYNIRNINLSHNKLTGSIPTQLGGRQNLVALTYLNLSNNKLSDSIPGNLENIKTLQYLNLSNNKLSGNITPKLGNLVNLYYLILDSNKLTGSIPSLSKLKQLDTLSLTYNRLEDSIPSSLGDLKHLQYLDVTHNNLNGAIPSSFINLTNLQNLSVTANQLSGTAPSFLTGLPKLKKLNIVNNSYTFDGMETLVENNFKSFKYNSQKNIDIHQTSNTLSVYAGGTLSNNTYKWFSNGALITTKNGDSTFTPIAGGNYTVQVTNAIATALTLYSDTVSFTALKAVDQNNIAAQTLNENRFSIYPNPAKTSVTITFTAIGNYTLKITDASGNVLQTKTGIIVNGKNTIQLDVSKYASGVYFVTVTSNEKEMQTLQLNKQ